MFAATVTIPYEPQSSSTVMVADPTPTAVTVPVWAAPTTVATPGELLVQVDCGQVTSCPVEKSLASTRNVASWPTLIAYVPTPQTGHRRAAWNSFPPVGPPPLPKPQAEIPSPKTTAKNRVMTSPLTQTRRPL